MATENPYDILGIAHDATPDEVKKAYRKKARENHPDLHPNDASAVERMNKINEAYDRIVNPEKYAARDRRSASSSGTGGAAANPYSNPYGQGSGQAGAGQDSQNPYGWTFVDFDDLFGFGGTSSGSREPIHPESAVSDSPQIRGVVNDINAGRHREAVRSLNEITSDGRNARWYYLSALANDGAGNTLMASEQIRRAIRLEPVNPDYQRAQRYFQQAGKTYQQEGQAQGFSMGIDPTMLCIGIWCCGPTLCRPFLGC